MLDADQARVVAHGNGPAAVLAGAGSGKTRCTTERAARRLTEDGLPSDGVVLLTFTNKAAGEMRERLAERLPAGVATPWIGTFHSFGYELIRRHARTLEVPRNATLMDADDAGRMLDALLAGPFAERERRQEALRVHEAAVAAGLDVTHGDDAEGVIALGEEAGFGPVACARLLEKLRRYDREKRSAGVLDFADLIQLPIRLLRDHPDVADELRARLRDVTVDEAQDTDGAQFRLLRAVTPADETIILVGDDDQAIYEWRHARPSNLRDFIDAFGATVYRLERNYRSTPAIVTGGSSLVHHNTDRLPKAPYAVRAGDVTDEVGLTEYRDADAMAEGVAEALSDRIRGGVSAAEMAVLYRKNRLSRVLEGALLRHGVPYRIKAGTDLLGYSDVRVMLAAGRLAANRRDVRALSRLADLVPGLGAKGVSRLVSASGDPLARTDQLPPRAAQGVADLARALDRLAERGPEGLFEWCQTTSLFSEWLRSRARRRAKAEGGGAEAIEQAMRPAWGRLRAVQAAMDRRVASRGSELSSAERWHAALEVIAAGTDEAESDEPKVTLSTVHGAKGLEWPEVHILGFTEGLMPMQRDGEVLNLAEERRLAYVAVTRAASRLTLHHADRIDQGTGEGTTRAELSRFVDEITAEGSLRRVDRRPGATAAGAESAPATDWLAAMRENLGR
jgi:DNA helicase-2/ATP-dependent DNA helicase PcrA